MQVGLSLRELLMQHMLRFKFSMFGALQWKRDIADYQEAAARLKEKRVSDAFEQVCMHVAKFMNPEIHLMVYPRC